MQEFRPWRSGKSRQQKLSEWERLYKKSEPERECHRLGHALKLPHAEVQKRIQQFGPDSTRKHLRLRLFGSKFGGTEEFESEGKDVEGESHGELRLGGQSASVAGELEDRQVKPFSNPPPRVHIYGLYARQIKPHLEEVKPYKEAFDILPPPNGHHEDLAKPDRNYKDRSGTGESKWAIMFGSDAGLNEYLKHFGWQHLLDKP